MPAPPTIPGTGYVSLGDYLNANQGTLARGFGSLQQEAQGDVAGGNIGATQELGRQVGSEAGLAGRYGGTGGQFDAALEWAQYGPQLQSLGNYLGQQADSMANAPPPVAASPVPPDTNGREGIPPGTRGATPQPPYTGVPFKKGLGGK